MKLKTLTLLTLLIISLSGCDVDLGPFDTLLNTCVFAGECGGGF